MCSFKSIYFVIFILNLYKTNAQISDKRLCGDPDCNVPISLAKTLLRYPSPDPSILSFAPNEEVKIYSKEAGSHMNLWGAEIRGKRGYIPKDKVREYKVFKKPTFLVDTDPKAKPQVPIDVNKDTIEPNKVQKSFEVVDGTTIFENPDGINPSGTDSPLLATAVPPGSNEAIDKTETLDDSKEKSPPAEQNAEKSVLENVYAQLSDLISNAATSEEFDDEDDDDEDEDDEYEEDEASIEEVKEEKEASDVKETIPSSEKQGHMNTSAEEVVPDSVKVEQTVNVSGDAVKEDASKENMPPIQEEGTEVAKIATPEEKPALDPKISQSKEAEVKKDDNLKAPPNVEAVTEPSIGEDEVVTSNPIEEKPVEAKVEEKPAEASETVPVLQNVPSEETEEQKVPSGDVPTSADATTEEKSSLEVTEEQKGQPVNTQTSLNTTTEEKSNSEVIEEQKVQPGYAQTSSNATAEENSSGPPPELPPVDNPELLQSPPEVTQPSPLEGNVETEKISNQIPKEILQPNVNSQSISPIKPHIENEAEKPSDFSPSQPLGGLFKNAEIFQSKDQKQEDEDNSFKQPVNAEEPKKEDASTEESTDAGSQEEIVDDVSKENISEIVKEEGVSNTDSALENLENTSEEEFSIDEVKSEVQDEDLKEEDFIIEDNDLKASEEDSSTRLEESGGFFIGLLSMFGSLDVSQSEATISSPNKEEIWSSTDVGYCDASSEGCNISEQEKLVNQKGLLEEMSLSISSNVFLLLTITAASVILLLFGFLALDRNGREAPLVAKINKLEKDLLITLKENELLQEKSQGGLGESQTVPGGVVEQLTHQLEEMQLARQALVEKVEHLEKEVEDKEALEDQIESLEKELETSTEVGMELNRIISEMLDPTNGSEKLKENVEQLQRQLLEQKDTINRINETLRDKEAENQKLYIELEKNKKKSADLQSKLDEMVEKVLKIEKEKDQQQSSLQNEIDVYRQKYGDAIAKADGLNNDIQVLRMQLAEVQRVTEIKTKEYQLLKESLNKVKAMKNDSNALKSLLDTTTIRAELQQLKIENTAYAEQLQQEQTVKVAFEKQYQGIVEEVNLLKRQYEQADKEKVEVNSKLEVLNNYFRKREGELQEEIIKYKSIWDAKEGEATSTTERMKYMKEEIENYKAQNETLKQEIISQEIDLKSQISMLEKKVHENWVSARQTERKLEDARQEAAQLRNRLTLRERAINEERIQNRLQSPIEQNGDLPLSPHPIDSPASPPLMYGGRDHITKSPPIPGLPPFLPPPPGAPFMPPPPHGMPPFMPPPPSMYPGDHRPPPLGRMSSPPLNSRYSPEHSAFSPYDRHSPSPPYDSEYGASPPPIRGYSPYNSRDDRREYKRPPHSRTNGRNMKGSMMSSGSDHSNDSLDKINRKQSKMV